jgi:hypothetical protein
MSNLALRRVPVIALAMLLAACGSIPTDQQLTTFAAATTALSGSARQAIDSSNQAVVQRKLRETAELGAGVNDALFTPLVSGDPYDKRVQLLDALQRYAAALDALAHADNRQQIESAATDLGGALDSLGERYSAVAGKSNPFANDGALVAGIVAAVGEAVSEQRRRDGIRLAIETQHPGMLEVLPVLRNELGSDGVFATAQINYADGEVATLMSRYNADHEARRLPADPDKRLERLQKIEQARDAAADVRQLYARLDEALGTLIGAEQALYDVVTAEKKPEDLYGAVARLADSAQAVKRVRDRLEKK